MTSESFREHTEGRNYIMACFVTLREFVMMSETIPNILNVEYMCSFEFAHEHGLVYPADERSPIPATDVYVLSPISKDAKYTMGMIPCISFIITGRDRQTGEIISMLSHINPWIALEDRFRVQFVRDIATVIREFQRRTEDIDCVAIGTNKIAQSDALGLIYESVCEPFGLTVKVYEPKDSHCIDNVLIAENSRNIFVSRDGGDSDISVAIESFDISRYIRRKSISERLAQWLRNIVPLRR